MAEGRLNQVSIALLYIRNPVAAIRLYALTDSGIMTPPIKSSRHFAGGYYTYNETGIIQTSSLSELSSQLNKLIKNNL